MMTISREELIRDMPRFWRSFLEFHRDCLGYVGLVEAQEDLIRFMESDDDKKLVLMPRFSYKSTIVTVSWSLWQLVRDTNLRVLIYSDSSTKAGGFWQDIRNHIEGNGEGSRFREYYGKWDSDPKSGKWNDSCGVISVREKAWKEPTVDTGGIETSKVGMHYDLIIFDDIVSDLNTTTKAQMDKVYDCYKKSLSLLKPGGKIVVVGTRWHFGDAYGRMIADGGFKVFHVDAEKDKKYGEYPFMDVGLTPVFLSEQRRVMGSYLFSCNPAEAPILMEDWTTKNICDVKEGEFVIGWELGEGNTKRKILKSKVLKVQSRNAHVVKVYLESGKIIRCTHDHQWFTNRNDISHAPYLPAKVGRPLFQVYDHYLPEVPDALLRDAAWLGGIFDGEGHCSKGSIYLAQCKDHNPEVHKRIGEVLNRLGFDNKTCGRGHYWINGGRAEKLRFIKWCKPVKAFKIISSLYYHNSWLIEKEDKVIDIKYDKEDKVYALQTETGNYVAWGFASKNCLYNNNPVDDETAVFKHKDFKFYKYTRGMEKNLYITCTIDPAGEGEDFTGITVVGTDENERMYLLDAVNEHLQPNLIVERVKRLNYKWNINKLGVETNFFRGMLEKEIDKMAEEERSNPNWKPFSREVFLAGAKKGEGKHTRILALQPFHERGDLLFPGDSVEGLSGAFSELAYQMIQFPKGQHDDVLDSLAWHVGIIRRGKKTVRTEEVPETSAAGIEKKDIDEMIRMNRRLPLKYRNRIRYSFN